MSTINLYRYEDESGCGHFFVGTEKQVRQITYARNIKLRAHGGLSNGIFKTTRGATWRLVYGGSAGIATMMPAASN